jgi:hypothetical protein
MAQGNRNEQFINAGKRTSDEFGYDASMAVAAASAAKVPKGHWFPGLHDKYDHEGFAVDNTPYEAHDPMGA